MKKIICALVCLILHMSSPARSLQLSGKVCDQCNHPVPYATIASKKRGIVYALADRDGSFQISNSWPGDTLVCSQTDYTTKEEEIEGNTVINFYLERRPLVPYQVDLTGKGKSQTPVLTDNHLEPVTHSDEHLKTRVEIHSSYPGRADKLKEYLKTAIDIPKGITQKKISGAVKVGFFVEKDGSVTYPILMKGINTYYDQVVIDAIIKTTWHSADQNGRKVRSRQEVVVYF